MALFESYERREKQVLAVLAQYGINLLKNVQKSAKEKALILIKSLKAFSLSVLKMLSGLIQ